MDRYVRVEQRKNEQSSIQENEVRIMAAGKMRNYITYATALVTEKGHTSVVLKAMGRAINKTVTVAEIIKRRIPGLHQNTAIGSVDITDTWEPLEEGLNRLETTRHVSVITITLSSLPLDTSLPGYQAPLPDDQVKPLQEGALERRPRPAARGGSSDIGEGDGNGGNGGGAGGRGGGRAGMRGRGRAGRGNGRGRGRGGPFPAAPQGAAGYAPDGNLPHPQAAQPGGGRGYGGGYGPNQMAANMGGLNLGGSGGGQPQMHGQQQMHMQAQGMGGYGYQQGGGQGFQGSPSPQGFPKPSGPSQMGGQGGYGGMATGFSNQGFSNQGGYNNMGGGQGQGGFGNGGRQPRGGPMQRMG
ncbi:hypothetical protein WJX72_000280 [[Myrmecia] bisecta]|uniref:DNA/RNA-binding protein Alba-like domain-containing protein n=1 Tax=[Myrmecia] bisecta TaxID=41462 RepID=A0AAW1Q6B1_9CHLO